MRHNEIGYKKAKDLQCGDLILNPWLRGNTNYSIRREVLRLTSNAYPEEDYSVVIRESKGEWLCFDHRDNLIQIVTDERDPDTFRRQGEGSAGSSGDPTRGLPEDPEEGHNEGEDVGDF